MWGPRQPSWQYVREFGDWIARTQLILQTGVPRVDVGLYRHKYIDVDIKVCLEWRLVNISADKIKHYGMGENIFGDPSLANNGYSYVSISPSLLQLGNAVVEGGLLAGPSPGFSAFAVDNYTNITSEAVSCFLEYANDGFPLIFVGPVPEVSPYYSESDEFVGSGIQKLLNYPSVKHVSTEAEVVSTLKQLGVSPAVQNLSPCPILWTHRIDEANGVNYFWVYNSDIYQSHATEAAIRANGIPYQLDAWTGAITPILNYTTNGDRYQIWMSLKSNASTFVAFAPEGFFTTVSVPKVHVTSTDFEDLSYSIDNTIVARTTADTSHSVTLSDGRNLHYGPSGSLPAPKTLGPWQLVIQDWLPNPDPWNNYTSVFTYHNVSLNQLIPWYNISGLENTSGIGTYTTQFSWPSNSSAVGAYLDLGFIFNTARLWVNGHWTRPIDVFDPVVDIGPYLNIGTNQVKIEVSSTLRNRLIQVNVTQSWAQAKYSSTYGPQPYGLTEPVMLKPYLQFKIPLDS